MKAEIVHKGRITAIGETVAEVSFLSDSACGSCHAAALCGSVEARQKRVEVPAFQAKGYKVGDEVEVALGRTMGLKAVWVSYVLPLAVLLAVVLGLTALGVAEWAAGLYGLGGVAVYYFVIWLLRDRVAKDYVFYLK